MHRLTSDWPWRLTSRPISLYGQPFSRYTFFVEDRKKNRKCTESPQIDLKQSTGKSTHVLTRCPNVWPFRSTINHFHYMGIFYNPPLTTMLTPSKKKKNNDICQKFKLSNFTVLWTISAQTLPWSIHEFCGVPPGPNFGAFRFQDTRLLKIRHAPNDLRLHLKHVHLTVKSTLYTLSPYPQEAQILVHSLYDQLVQDTKLSKIGNIGNAQNCLQTDIEHLTAKRTSYTLSHFLPGPNLLSVSLYGLLFSRYTVTENPRKKKNTSETHWMTWDWPWMVKGPCMPYM